MIKIELRLTENVTEIDMTDGSESTFGHDILDVMVNGQVFRKVSPNYSVLNRTISNPIKIGRKRIAWLGEAMGEIGLEIEWQALYGIPSEPGEDDSFKRF